MSLSVAAACNGSLQVYGFGIVLILGSFQPNGTSAPLLVKGKGFSVAYTSTGCHTLTFTNSALSVLSCWLTCQSHAAMDPGLEFGDIDVVTALTAVILNAPAGVAGAWPSTNANTRCHFGFCMATSSLNS